LPESDAGPNLFFDPTTNQEFVVSGTDSTPITIILVSDSALSTTLGLLINAASGFVLKAIAAGETGLVVADGHLNLTSNSNQINFFAATKFNFNIAAVPVFANNAAALAGGLVAGDVYRTGANPDPVCIVH
jgi:hypothetical protein